ncbi:inositol monophosphatase family protein [Marinomonas primoryensis]|jgi:fructose-1,6-bisphosphatase/inositol monophosphatase family enzyme|uniref:Inositol monophosphatase n=1 Tax=Marinomonas primoryensis TaxID=178399 RepID=A0A859CZJ3_9GAMM|nr:inositol monophosphatase [Marinomonas primoryensis]QKK79930.1 inositol monophosphatase [Marinomonas primoryensis]|tara:strand:- start:4788 stop:5642 length:855 start_codon:yes stop_codon:yes gene_type:complete
MNLDKLSQDRLIDIVRRAGQEIVMPSFRQLNAADVEIKSSLTDLVTVADKASEAFITAEIQQAFPDWEIVGEEAVAEDPSTTDKIATADTCVIIDPIDGTWNYAHGLSDFGIILAVVVKGVTRFGLLYDPVNDDWIYANLGEGAFFQRTAMNEKSNNQVPNQTPLALQITAEPELDKLTGIMSVNAYTGQKKQDFALKASRFVRINNLPSCPAYRQIAQGHFNFSLTYKMLPWDHAAGVLVHTEAGGVCRTLEGKEYSPAMLDGEMLAAQSEQQWQELAEYFRK